MIFLEIKCDHQGFTVVIGCEFCTLWGEEGSMISKGENMAVRVHTDCMNQKCCYKNTIACCRWFFTQCTLVKDWKVKKKITNVFLARAQPSHLNLFAWTETLER